MKRKRHLNFDSLKCRVVLSDVGAQPMVAHHPVPHLTANQRHELAIARADLAHSSAHPKHGQPLAFAERPTKSGIHAEQMSGSGGFGGGNVDPTVPFILATQVGGVAQNQLNFTSNTYHGVLFGFEWNGIQEIATDFANDNDVGELDSAINTLAVRMPYGRQMLLPTWQSDLQSLQSGSLTPTPSGIDWDGNNSVAQGVGDTLFQDLQAYLSSGFGVSFNVLKSGVDWSDSDNFLTYNGFVADEPSSTIVTPPVTVAGPAVTGISPTSGPATGDTTVTFTGTGFTGATAVDFGTVAATSFTVVSDTQLTAVSPALPTGSTSSTVDTTVTTPNGTSTTSTADQFTYTSVTSAAPTVTVLDPTTGPAAGGTLVTITGTNFTGATAVHFGTVAATDLTVVSATSITADSPAGTSGSSVDVTVTTPDGTSATGTADKFTYATAAAAPTVASISPTTGPSTGGTTVTITGTGFTGATLVEFGTTAATSFTVVSPTDITAVSPALPSGSPTDSVHVTVTTPAGASAQTTADLFQYTTAPTAPTVASLNPTSGPLAGGTLVTITGTEFTGATAVDFGTIAATNVTVISATEITADSPAGTGTVDVTVTTPAGTSATSSADQFTYAAAPSVTTIHPATGPAAGGTTVTIVGTAFTGATVVDFGTVVASFTFLNDTTIAATSPVGTAGSVVDVTVTTPGGTSATSVHDQFTYTT